MLIFFATIVFGYLAVQIILNIVLNLAGHTAAYGLNKLTDRLTGDYSPKVLAASLTSSQKSFVDDHNDVVSLLSSLNKED